MSTTQPTDEGKRLIDRWVAARDAKKRAEDALNREQCEVANSTNALGKWMCPPDARDGETFCVWYGDSLIAVTRKDEHTFDIVIRSRGREASRAGLR